MNKLTALSILTVMTLLGASAEAANRTWTGGGADNNWNTATNWGGTAPVAGDLLFFDGNTRLTNTNNIAANTAFNGISFNSTAGAFTLRGNALNLAGGVTNNCPTNPETVSLNMALTATRTFSVVGGGSLSLSGVVSGTGFGVTKGDAGTLTLGGVNSYTGGTTINGGTVSITADGNLGGTGGLTFANGGTLLNTGSGAQSTSRAITLNGGGGVITLSGPTLTLTGTISGGGGLTTSGSDLILNGAGNNTIGTMTVNSGRLFVYTTGAIANSAILVINNGATLDFGSTAPASPANSMTFASGACLANRLAGTLTVPTTTGHFPTTGTMIFNADDQATTAITVTGAYPALTGDLTVQVGGSAGAPGNVTLSGAISGSYGLLKTSNGTLILSAASSYTGSTTISAGTLRLGAANVLPDGSGKGNVTVNGTLDLGGFSETINGLSGNGTVDNAVGTGAYTLTVGNNNQTSAFSGTITDTTGRLSLTKVGTGSLTLSGATSFSGSATVLAGTLAVQKDGGLGSVTNVSIGTGATLALSLGAANNYINDAATVSLTNTAVINLAFAGSDTVANLYIGGVRKSAGTWGATGSGATFVDNTHFQGTGVLNVTAGPTSGTAISGSPNPSTWGQSVTFTATVTGTNGTPPLTGTVTFKDAGSVLGTGALSGSPAATATFSTNGLAAGTHTITAVYSGDSNFGGSTSGNFTQTVRPGALAKLQLLVPGETAAPGTTTGKTGTPTQQIPGTAFNVTVNAVDANWNVVSTNDTVKITSSDASAILPANAALVAGTKAFSVTLVTLGSSTITASDVTHTNTAASASPPIPVGGVLPALQTRPVVGIHDSELTRALETMTATAPTPLGAGTTGYQWWPTNWHYFVMTESVKETLRSDGTAYEVVGDADISAGRLLAANGQPRCPIIISLASEAIRDDEIAQLTNYVAAGGTLLVGSSAFTRNTNGTSRGDFALAASMGVHMATSSLTNWGANNTFTKFSPHLLTSHIPSGTLTWRLPTAAEEIPWGISPAHPFLAAHPAWQVQSIDATVLAQGDVYPYLLTKSFGKGQFIYVASMQPLIGFNSFAPTMYSYVIFRKAIEWAFQSAKLPVPKLSPWPYAYDAAFVLRRDLENFTNAIASVAASAQIDYTNGASGDYYFCTGTLREDAAPTYNTNTIITGLRQSVSNYAATIYPHNGGLKNPNNPALVRGQLDYWHWGPDEALDVTPTNYPSGKSYALASISNSFYDVEHWMSGLTNGLRGWSGCFFNATREDSYAIQAQLKVNMTGDQKLTPFPHWTLSTRTNGMRYAVLSEPVSDWFVNGLVAQSLEPWHPPGVQTSQTLHDGVDFYYNLGALLNFYSHTLSTGLGDAGSLPLDYITYSLNTNRHPRLWSANAAKVYQWWLARSNAQVIPSYSTNGNQSIATLSISGAMDARTAVEFLIPQSSFSGLQVFTNGTAASGSSYRTSGQVVKLMVGTTVTNAVIQYNLAPTAQNDLYNVAQSGTLAAPAPGVLTNDLGGLGGTLAAVLAGGPSHGALALNADGGFTYTPATNFTGVDTFTYQASDGTTNSTAAIVTICVAPAGLLFADDFTRPAVADSLLPWQVASGAWLITNGMLQATGALQSYSFAYISNNWTDYYVQGRFQFPAGAFGGGLGGRLDPMTGAHYAAWIYPEASPGGSATLELLKFQNWSSYGYNGSAYASMDQISLPSVGTNWHSLRLTFRGNVIGVYYDDNLVMTVTDTEVQPLASGGISLDMWTGSTPYVMAVDDVSVGPGATDQTITFGALASKSYGDPPFTVSATASSGLPVTFSILSGPATIVSNTVIITGVGTVTVRASQSGNLTYYPALPVDQSFSVDPAPDGLVWADTFARPLNPGSLSPWVVQQGLWAVTNDVLQGSSAANGYSSAWVGGAWTNYSVEGQVQFSSTSGWGGGIGGRLDPVTGAHYAAWIYPDASPGGANILRLIKFSGWTSWSGTPMAEVAIPAVGTNWHTLKLAFLTNQITLSFDGLQVTNVTDNNFDGQPAYLSGGITADMFTTFGTPYIMSVDNVLVRLVRPALAVAANDASRAYGAPNPAFTGTLAGLQNGDNITATYSTTANTNSPTAGYSIVPTLNDPDHKLVNYNWTIANGTLTITQATLTVTADAKTKVYGDSDPALTYQITTGSLANGDGLSGNMVRVAGEAVGTRAIERGTLAVNTNYFLTFVPGQLTITARPITVTADAESKVYGSSDPALTYQITSGSLVNGDVLSGSLARAAGEGVGAYAIQQGDLTAGSNYNLSFVPAGLSINRAALTVTADPQTRSYGAANPGLTATITGFVNGDTQATAVTGTPSLTTAATAASPVGSYDIVPALGALSAANYSFGFVNGTLSVTPATLTGTADGKSRLYGAANPPFTVSYSGFVNGQDASVVSGTLSGSTTALTNSPVGSYPISVSGQSAPNYTIHYVDGTLTVTAAPLLVKGDNTSRAYGQANPAFSATISGWVNGEDTQVLGGALVLTSPALTNSPVGPYAIIPDGLTSTNYAITFSNGTLTVTAYALSVTADSHTRSYGAANPALGGSISGLQNGDNIAATYATSADTNSPVGGYPITPSLVDPDGKLGNYSLTTNHGTLTVNAAGLTVTANDASRTYGAADPGFGGTITGIQNGDNISAAYATTAMATSPVGGYPIAPTLVDPNGKLSNYTVSITNGTLSVTAAGLTVTASDAFRTYGATDPGFGGTITGIQNGDNISATYATTATATSPVGTYPITPTVVDPSGKLSNYNVSITSGTLNVTAAGLTVKANDASRTYGATNPLFGGTITGIQNGDNITATYATTATATSTVGSYPITPTLVDPSGKLSNYTVNSSNGTLTVNAAGLTVKANDASRVYGATDPLFGGTITGIQNGDNITATYATTATVTSPVGTYSITPTLVDPNGKLSNYSVSSTNATLTVTPASLRVTAGNKSKTYGAVNPALTASYSGFVNGDTTSVLSGSPSLTTAATVSSPVGIYPITAATGTLAATNYTFSFVNGSLTVAPAALIVAADNKSKTYGTANLGLTGSVVGVQNGDNITATYATTATGSSPVGAYPITPSLVDPQGKLGNYSVTTNAGTLTVNRAALTVTADPQTRSYGAANPGLTATITGFVNGDTQATAVTGTPSLTTAAAAASPVGSYDIVPALGALSAANYSFGFVNGTLSVTPATLTGTADGKSRLYGAANPPFTVSYSGFVNGQDASVVSGTLSGSTTALTNSPVGSYPISVSGQSAPNYTIHYVDGTLTVAAAPLLVKGDNTTRAYGQANPAFSATISGWVNGEDTQVLGGALVLTSPALTNSPVGPYAIIPDGLTSTNYAITFSNGTLTVTAYALSVTADSHTRSYGAANPALGGSITGIQNGDNITATYATSADTNSPVGTYSITPTLVDPDGKLGNYSLTTSNGTLTVNAAGLTVSADNQSKTYGAANPGLTGSVVGVQNGDNITATYATTATGSSPVGAYPITPSLVDPQGKLGNYSVTTNAGTLTVNRAALTVTADPQTRSYGAANPGLTATITGFVNGDTQATAVTGTPSLTTAAAAASPVGSYDIVPALGALSAANYSFGFVNGTLSVTPATLTGTADGKSRLYGAANPSFTVSYSGFVNGQDASVVSGTLSGSTTALTNSPVGSYPISVSGQSAPNYTIHYVDGTLTVAAAPLLVKGDNTTRAYGQANPAFSATISGWVNGEDTQVLGGALVLTSPALTNSPVGPYAIIPDGLTSTNYAITFSNGTLTVTAYALSVTADSHTRSYGAANPALGGSITGIQNGDNITATYATSADTNSPVGTYSITPTLVDPDGKLGNYSLTTSNGTLTVNAAGLTVSADNQSKTYGAANLGLTGSVVGVQNGDNITATYATTATGSSPVGAYPITPSLVDPQGKLGNYSVTTNAGTLTVNRAALTVTADPQTRSYGAANPGLTATITGFVNGDTQATAVTGTPSLTTAAAAASPVGSYDIVPALGALSAANYSFGFVNGTLSVTPATLTGTADGKSRLYGAANPSFTVSYSGFVNGQDASVVSGTLSGSTTALTNSPVGSYPISVSGQSAPNYTIHYVDGTLTVAAAPLLVKGDNTTRAYGQANPAFSATISGWVNGEDTQVLGGALVLTSPALTNSPVGPYAIIPDGLTSTNYAITFSNGTLTVTAYALSVTADSHTRSYGAANPALGGSITGIQNGDNITATYATSADTNSPVGTYSITPTLVDPDGKLGNYSLTTSNGTLTVNAAGLTVSADNQSKTYGAANLGLTGSVVGVQNGDNITATYATTATGSSPVGAYPITPSLVDPQGKLGNYSVTTNAGTLTVNRAALTVTADPQTRSYGAANPGLTATITGFVNGDTQATAVTGTPSLTTAAAAASPVGSYDIVPALGALSAANYSFGFVNGTLSVTPATLTGTADGKSRLYGAANPPFTVSYSGFVNGQDASVVSGTLSGSTTALTNSPVGSYPISVSGQSAPNYTIHYVDGTLTVAAAPLLVKGDNTTRAYGQANPAFSATISGWVNGEDTQVLGGALVLTSPALTNSPVGPYAIIPDGLTSTNYAITFSNGTLTVTAYALSVTADSHTRSYGAANPALGGSITGIQNGDNITATYATSADTNSPVGTYSITPTLVDPDGKLGNYSLTTSNGTLTVNAAGLTVSADNQSKTYGAANPGLTGSVVGVQNGDNITATYATTATGSSPVGAYPITPSLVDPQGKLGNYSVTTNAGTLTVNRAALTVTADPQTRSYGAANPGLTATITGFVNGDTQATAVTGTPSLTTAAAAASPVGSYDIVPALGALSAANYSFGFVNGTLSVTPATLTGTADGKSRLYGAANPSFTVSYSGFVNGQDASVVSGTLSGSTTALTNSPVGSYPISVSGQSAPNYTIHYVDGTLTVAAAPLLVKGDNTTRAYGQANPAFSATISGWVNGEDTQVLGGALVLTSPALTNSPVGPYAIIPDGLTSTNYAITFSNGTLTVTAYALSVTADSHTRSYGAANPALGGSITGIQNGDNITATYATSADTNSPVGTYSITPTLVDPDGKLGNYSLTTSNGTLTVNAAGLTVSADNQSKTYGAANLGLTGSVVGVQNGDNITATYATTATGSSPVGAYPITPSLVDPQGKLGNYSVTTNAGTLTVNRAALTVTADPQTRSYGAANPGLTATITGFVNGDTQATAVTGTPSLTTAAAAASPVGSYDIVPALGALSAANYSFGFVNGTLSVTPATLTGTADGKSRLYGAANPPFTVSYSGFVNGQDASVVSGTLSGSTTALTNSPVGSYPISVSGQSAPNYTIHYVDGTLTVAAAPLLVKGDNTTRAYGQANPAFSATISGWVNGEDTQVLGGALVLTSPALTNSPVGPYAIIPDGLTSTNYAITFSNGTLTVTAYALSVTADSHTRSYGAANPALGGSITGIQNGDNITATYATSADTNSPVGTYSITPTLVDPDGKLGNYSLTTSNGTLTVNAAGLTVSADNQSKTYGAANLGLTGSVVGVQNGDNITATYATTATGSSPVGAYPITPSLVDPQGKLGNYSVTTNAGTLTVNRAALTVTADPQTRSYGAANPGLTATITGFVNGDTQATAVTGTPSLTTAAAAASPVGSYDIVPALGALSAANYSFGFVNGTLSVTPATLTGTADGKSRLYGAANPPFTVSYSGFVNGQDASVVSGTLSGSTTALTNSPVGSYPISVSGQSAPNYTIHYVDGTLTVAAAPLLVKGDNTTRAYGQANPAFSATISGWVNGEDTQVLGGALVLTSPALTNSPVGPYAIIPDGLTSTNYAITFSNGTLTVTAYALSVTADSHTRSYGAANPALGGSITGIQNGDNITATYATSADTNSPVGTYSITPTLVDPDGKLGNYSLTTSNGTLTVNAAGLTVSADNQSKTYGAANPGLTGSVVGVQNGDNITATYATTATGSSPVGAYPITPSLVDPQGKLGNYSVTTNAGTLTVNRAALTVTADPQTRSYGAANPGLTATITGFVNGDTQATAVTGTPSLTTAAAAASPVGSYDIVPALGALSAANYSFGFVNGTLSVTAAALTVKANDASRTYGAANPALSGAITGLQNGDNISATYATTATVASAVGTYPITPTAVDPDHKLSNYAVTLSNGTLTVTPAPSPTILSIKPVGNNSMVITWASVSTSVYRVQCKANLASTNWINLAPDVTATASTASFTDSLNGAPRRFYRVALLSNVTPLTPLVVVVNNASRVYGRTNPVFTGTITGLQSGDNISATYDTTATVGDSVGGYLISPTLVDANGKLANYSVTVTNGILTVTPAELTVVANNASRNYGAANPVFSGTITGVQNNDNIKATYASAATGASAVGTYPITPTLVGSPSSLGNYTVTLTSGTLTVTTAGLAVTANNASRPYGAANPAFTGTLTGIQNGDNITANYGTTATVTSTVGTYPITPTLVDPSGKLSNYAVSTTNGTLTVTTAGLAVTANNASRPYGAANPAFTGTLTGIQNGDNITANYGTTATVTSTVGTYPITPTLVDPSGRLSNYAVSTTNGTLTVTTAGLAVTANNASRSYGAVNPTFTGTLTGIQNGDNITANYGTTATVTSTVGTYPITPTLVDPSGRLSNYAVSTTNGTLTVTTVGLAVTANNASRPYGAANPALTGTLTGIQNGDNITANYGTTATVTSTVGTYSITPTLVDPSGRLSNYAVSTTNGTLTVTTAGLAVTANNASRPYGAANPAFTGTLTGIKNGDNITANYGTTATVTSTVGTYPITPTLVDPSGKLSNYTVSSTNGSLTVAVAGLTVKANDTSRAYGTANPAFTGTITGIQNGDNITATYATTATISSPAGTYPITPSLVDPGNKLPNYNVTLSSGTLTVTAPATPTILSLARTGNTNFVITWTSASNSVYRVQYKATLASTNWISLTPDVTATGSTASYTDHPAGAPQRYYRILLVSTTPLTQPVIQSIVGAGTPNLVVTWSALNNRTYHVQYKTNLTSANWSDLSPDITATGSTASFTDHPAGVPQRYYRVGLLP